MCALFHLLTALVDVFNNKKYFVFIFAKFMEASKDIIS